MKQIVDRKKAQDTNSTCQCDYDVEYLLLTRKLGHKKDIPGAERWIMHRRKMGLDDKVLTRQ